MMTYSTPDAFKAALEQRLRDRAPTALPRERQLFIYTRFLARVSTVMGDHVTLKGGLALELRLAKARSPKTSTSASTARRRAVRSSWRSSKKPRASISWTS